MQLRKLLQSSANTEKLSMTIKGTLTGIVVMLSFTGVIPADAVKEVGPITEAIVSVIQAMTAVLASIWTAYGLLRKAYYLWFIK